MNGCVIFLTGVLAVTSPNPGSDGNIDSKTRAYIKVEEIVSMVQAVQDGYGNNVLSPPLVTRIRTIDGTKFTVHMSAPDVMKLPCMEIPQRQATKRQEPERP